MTLSIDYRTLRGNYPAGALGQPGYVSRADLFREIGSDDFIGDPNMANTCAIRVSMAFMRSGHPISPRSHRILAGEHEGAGVEVNMTRLATLLARPVRLGDYEVLTANTLGEAFQTRRGVIAFHGIPGYAGGGHIDLVSNAAGDVICATSCYFAAREVWFWPLRVGTG